MPGRWSKPSRCEHCGRKLDRWQRCRRRSCPANAWLWSQDWKHSLLMNLGLELQDVALVTVTAPGEDFGLVWDRDLCSHPPGENCSGLKGCRVKAEAAQRWNASCESDFSRLHRAASAFARRRHGAGPLIAAKAWETQARGVDHLHIVIPWRTPRERARGRAYVAALKDRGARYGFGYADLRLKFEGGGGVRAASYLAKYVAKAAAPEMVKRRPVVVGNFLTKLTGLTMRRLRWRRYIWHRFNFRPSCYELRPVVDLLTSQFSIHFMATLQPRGP
jgi:hypothetical protein